MTSDTSVTTGGVPDPYIGRTIAGKIQILELLGQGGMGKVFKAKHVGLDKIVCVKTLKPSLNEDPTVVGRFEREAKAAGRLNHANSIQVLDSGQDEFGSLYIVMEYVSGKDLRKTLRDEFPLGEERICHIMAQVLSALADAHAMNVIHRDLKPENIMIEQRRADTDFVKVLDFGIAKIQEADVPGLTRADVVCGTPLYMSPEQATGSAFDARADLYAIGVILYQLTTGTLPFDGANSMEILTKHVTELPIPPRLRRPEVAISPDMEALILRALEKEPSGRPQTAEEFRRDLIAIQDKLKRAREDSAKAVKDAASQHKADRTQAMKEKQREQLAQATAAATGFAQPSQRPPEPASPQSFPSPTSFPPPPAKSRAPLFAGIGVGVAALGGAAYFFLAPPAHVDGPKDPAKLPDIAAIGDPKAVEKPPTVATPTALAGNQGDSEDEGKKGHHHRKPKEGGEATDAPEKTPEKAVDPAVAATAEKPPEKVAEKPPEKVVAEKPPEEKPPEKVAEKPKEPELQKGDTDKARSLVEQADASKEEEKFSDAIALYRKAIQADESYAPAWRGLYLSGVGAADKNVIREGGKGYLRAAPDAADAEKVRKAVERF